MNRIDLSTRVSERTGLTVKQSGAAVAATLEAIAAALAEGDEVTLNGFGTFTTRERKSRAVVHPVTGKRLQVPSSRGAAFTPAAALKRRLSAQAAPKSSPSV